MSIVIQADKRQVGFKQLFEGDSFKRTIASVLPKHLTADRMVRVVLSAIQSSPKLLECEPGTVVLSVLRAAAYGLEPDGGPLGQGYLVPFWSGKNKRLECQFIAGYRGLCKLARNSGEVGDIWAEVVYEADEFTYELGLDPKMNHVRNDAAADPGPLKYVYAVARFKDGNKRFVVMNKAEIEKIKATSASKDKNGNLVGPWVDWESEQWKKTAVRRICKMLPLSVEQQSQVSSDDYLPAPLAATFDGLGIPASQAGTIEHEPQATADELKSIATLDEFVIAVEGCTASGEPTALYDSWFGPERKRDWTPEEDEKARACVNAKEESLKQPRGLRSNKQQELVK